MSTVSNQTTQGIPGTTNGSMINTAMTPVPDGSSGGGNTTPPDTTTTTTSTTPSTTSTPAPDSGTVTTTSTKPDASPLEPAKQIKVDANGVTSAALAYKAGREDAQKCDSICQANRWAGLALNWGLVLFVLVLCAVMLRGKQEAK